ncbi:YncE family protein [Clostridium swellfunianum]|uniref:YncE family protein n=1 Tax=Clostridium swellfunianum TaxID=1367462 RepID=UPI002030C343|nr:YncE family protein [Clostridium swellfunianum]MCM0650636.1 YncE family protein [Clostridium swellfunianum]
MSSLFICNTSSDYISQINLAEFYEERRIPLGVDKISRIGPQGICAYKDKLLVANSYNNSLSILDMAQMMQIEEYFIGMHCNGVEVSEDNAYVVCGELNSIIIFNLTKKKIIEEIPCGSFPYSISIDKTKGFIAVANMHSDSITLIDCRNKENILNIRSSNYPTKAVFDESSQFILVAESNMGIKSNGTLSIIELNGLKRVGKIKVGNSPVDIFTEKNYCYVSNLGDGTISIVDIKNLKEIKRIKTGGMPRAIIKHEEYIYVSDSYNDIILQLNLKNGNKKVISVGKEPTAMTIY